MARSIWSGALTFGLVNVPVKLVTAVTQQEVHFNMLHAKDGSRIQLRRFCAKEEAEVPYEEIVKGYEVGKGRYVTVEKDELEGLAPKATRAIEIQDFVELAEIDPIYYERTYYLVPETNAARPYALLLEAMRRTGKVAIASFVLRTRESLCCVRPLGPVLALSTMNRADEVIAADTLELPEAAKPADRELQMAEQLVASLTARFEPERYPDTYRARVLELVERKAEGQTLEAPAPEERPAEVVSLADALSASLEAARRRADGTGGARGGGGQAPSDRGERRHPVAMAARTAGKPRAGRKK
jgi:DNA end-binding protein Ku